jgi:hypothetical protein
MKTIALLSIALTTGFGTRGETIQFDDLKAGERPPGWTATVVGQGEAKWTVATDESAPSKPNVLKQSGVTPRPSYPIALKNGREFKDGFVQVKFKPISGQIDQAGGVIWRAKDAANFYVCRANALENNVVLYKTEAGKRKALDIVGRRGGYGLDEPVAAGRWHTLRVEFSGPRFKVIFNGKELFEVEDSTFAEPGRVGLWTKADSVTEFDDFAFGSN